MLCRMTAKRDVTMYGRETRDQCDATKVLTIDEARRVASNIAKPPGTAKRDVAAPTV
jgi:K+/H+ antiporter YhaU regulatory subunit KhtT